MPHMWSLLSFDHVSLHLLSQGLFLILDPASFLWRPPSLSLEDWDCRQTTTSVLTFGWVLCSQRDALIHRASSWSLVFPFDTSSGVLSRCLLLAWISQHSLKFPHDTVQFLILKEAMDLKEWKERYMGWFEKGIRKLCNCIIISKNEYIKNVATHRID